MGAAANAVNIVGGASPGGSLTLTQIARGGAGGNSTNTGASGAGTSFLVFAETTKALNGISLARGGSGGMGLGSTAGGNGGTADAEIDVSGPGTVTVTGDASGGSGGNSVSKSGGVGAGASIGLGVDGTSTGGGETEVTGVMIGGSGGSGILPAEGAAPIVKGGDGAAAMANNAVGGSTKGVLMLKQMAQAVTAASGLAAR
jgi:hypothetical protein